MRIAQQLDFDMASALNKLFHKHFVAAERGQRFTFGLFERGWQRVGAFDDTHATTTATFGRFQDDRVAERFSHGERLIDIA